MRYEDTAKSPNRRPVPPAANGQSPDKELGQPHLKWESGKQFPIKNEGWMNRNSKYIEHVTYYPGDGQSGELRVLGHHPKRGEFQHTVPFEDREAMRQSLQRAKYSHVEQDDQMRDGGGQRHRIESDLFAFGAAEHQRSTGEKED